MMKLSLSSTPIGPLSMIQLYHPCHVLGTQIGFNLSLLRQIMDLPNVSEHCYVTAFDYLPTYDRTESEVYTAISLIGRKFKTLT